MYNTDDTYYLSLIDGILKKEFPEYYQQVKGLSKNERKNIPILSDSEILELHRKFSEEGDLNARNKLIYSQLRLVYLYTKDFNYKFNGTKLSPQDLLGFSNEILTNLIEGFDPTRASLPTYVQTYFKLELHKKLKDYGLEIRLPHNKINDKTAQNRYLKYFNQRFGREPYDGESFEMRWNSKDLRITIDYYSEEMLVEQKIEDEWVYKKTIKMETYDNVVSGNSLLGEEGGEIFDILEDEKCESYDDNKKLILDSILKIVDLLTDRERESIKLQYLKEKNLNEIPYLLKPNYNCKKETKTFNDTSKNTIDIYITKDSKEIHLEYIVTANFHVEPSLGILQNHEELLITHKHKTFSTNNEIDNYRFNLGDVENIKITHTTYDGSSEIEKYSYVDGVLSFGVKYEYGRIYTPQTFDYKQKQLIKKIRKKIKENNIKNLYL